MLTDPELSKKVALVSQKAAPTNAGTTDNPQQTQPNIPSNKKNVTGTNSTMLAQVVGVIIGSPEFQRR